MDDGIACQIAETYNRMGSRLDDLITQTPFLINSYRLYDHLIDRIAEGRRFQRALDVGCGSGMQSVRLAALSDEVIGIDIAEDLLHLARQRCRAYPRARFLREDARKLPFENASFDAVFSYGDVLSHIIVGYEEAVAEMARVAREGAVVSIEVDNKWTLGLLYEPAEVWHALSRRGQGHDTRRWEGMRFKTFTPGELFRLLEKHGLEPISCHGHNIFASLIPDIYLLETRRRSLIGRLALGLGRLDLALSGSFPFNRIGFNLIVTARKVCLPR